MSDNFGDRATRVLHFGLLLAVFGAAFFLRVWNLGKLPAGLYCDEAGLGYNAWLLLHHGVDETGKRWPLFIWSFGLAYKNPVFIYSAMLPIGILGLDEFSVRLTSALFGFGTVVAAYLLLRELMGRWAGLLAALCVAICPWHIHFSRIAFELVAFPFLFAMGCWFLARFSKGRATLPSAFFFFGLCLYAYAVAKLFVPLFLVGAVVALRKTIRERKRQWLTAAAVLVLTVLPVVVHDLSQRGRASGYFVQKTFFQGQSLLASLAKLGNNYITFFSSSFLLDRGDPLPRHALSGHGELLSAFIPFLFVGFLYLLFRRERVGKLLLWWLALYPLVASFMNEIPSASRGFIGSIAFCLIAAAGMHQAIGWLTVWIPPAGLRRTAVALISCALAGFLSLQARAYWVRYEKEYPRLSAAGIYGFQYGYRDVLRFMESRRRSYSHLVLTAVDVNQPEIFVRFYVRCNPRDVSGGPPCGYEIFDPAEYGRYSLERPALFALRPSDLTYFTDFDVLKEIVAPEGRTEFLVAEVRKRKRFVTEWAALGPYRNESGAHDPIDRSAASSGEWKPIVQPFVRVDLNAFFAQADLEHPGNPEQVCAYVRTFIDSPRSQEAVLELTGSEDEIFPWLDGKPLARLDFRLSPIVPWRVRMMLKKGQNSLVLQSCEGIGDWFFTARFTDAAGRDLDGLSFSAGL